MMKRHHFFVWSCLQLLLLHPSTAAARKVVSSTYLGCFNDYVGGARDLNGVIGISKLDGFSKPAGGEQFIVNSLTRDLCAAICSSGGFPYMGLQFSIGCYCGFSYGTQGASPESLCNTSCQGSPTEMCGGFNRNSVYRLTYLENLFQLSLAKPTVIAASSYPKLYSATIARNIRECIVLCSADCQAVIFNKPNGGNNCYLLKFPLVPSDIAGVVGDFYTLI